MVPPLVFTHQPADKAVVVAGGGDTTGGVGVADRAVIACRRPARRHSTAAVDAAAHQADVANRAVTGIAEQADLVRAGPVDIEVRDRVTQAVEHAGELRRAVADGHEARAAVPASGGRSVDVRAQHIVAGQGGAIAVDVLQLVRVQDDVVIGRPRGTCGRARIRTQDDAAADVPPRPEGRAWSGCRRWPRRWWKSRRQGGGQRRRAQAAAAGNRAIVGAIAGRLARVAVSQ